MTAASNVDAPEAAALATASCSAVRPSEGRVTVAAAYVRPSPSRTAAPSIAPTRARAARASVTSLASSGFISSGIGGLPLVSWAGQLPRADARDQHRVDPVAPACGALGLQPKPTDRGHRTGDRHPAERLGEQAGHGLDLVVRQLHREDLAEILDRQSRCPPPLVLAEPLHGGALDVVLVGDLPHDLLEDVLDGDEAGGATVLVDHDGHVG